MKHGRNLTLKQKKLLQSKGLNPDNWLVINNLPDKLILLNKSKGTMAEVSKPT